MTADKRRVLRMMCKAMLLVSLPLAGFAWALPETTPMMLGAGVLTLLSLAVGFGAEILASATEADIYELDGMMSAEGKRRAAELEARDEKLRQFDRIVGLLTEQNHSLRAKLIAVQIDLQRKKEALVEAADEAIGLDDAIGALNPGYSVRAH